MSGWYWMRDVVACIIAVIFYGIFMSVPKRCLYLSAVSGTVAYLVYRLIYLLGGNELLGYFVASLLVAVSAELMARFFKTPVTLLVLPGIIPLVPGVGLYRTMLCLVRNDLNGFETVFARTLLISGIIAVTVAVVNATVRNLLHPHASQTGTSASSR